MLKKIEVVSVAERASRLSCWRNLAPRPRIYQEVLWMWDRR